MNDRELLKLAAKAAGLSINFPDVGVPLWTNRIGYLERPWNPLLYPADALDLAVRLRIGTDCYVDSDLSEYCCAWVNHRNVSSLHRSYEPYAKDPVAATCRAIVRTAAEVGKAQDGR